MKEISLEQGVRFVMTDDAMEKLLSTYRRVAYVAPYRQIDFNPSIIREINTSQIRMTPFGTYMRFNEGVFGRQWVHEAYVEYIRRERIPTAVRGGVTDFSSTELYGSMLDKTGLWSDPEFVKTNQGALTINHSASFGGDLRSNVGGETIVQINADGTITYRDDQPRDVLEQALTMAVKWYNDNKNAASSLHGCDMCDVHRTYDHLVSIQHKHSAARPVWFLGADIDEDYHFVYRSATSLTKWPAPDDEVEREFFTIHHDGQVVYAGLDSSQLMKECDDALKAIQKFVISTASDTLTVDRSNWKGVILYDVDHDWVAKVQMELVRIINWIPE